MCTIKQGAVGVAWSSWGEPWPIMGEPLSNMGRGSLVSTADSGRKVPGSNLDLILQNSKSMGL